MILSAELAAWLRRAGVDVGASHLAGPGWLVVADLSPLYAAASGLRRAADEIDGVGGGLRRLLGHTAESLGWSGTAATQAGRRAERTGTRLGELAELLRDLAHELARHASDVEDVRKELRSLVDEAEHNVRQVGARRLADPLSALHGPGQDDVPDRVTALHRCAARMRELLDEAERQDHRRAARVVDLGSAILSLAAASEADSWVGDSVMPDVRTVLESAGIVPPAAERVPLQGTSPRPGGASTQR